MLSHCDIEGKLNGGTADHLMSFAATDWLLCLTGTRLFFARRKNESEEEHGGRKMRVMHYDSVENGDAVK